MIVCNSALAAFMKSSPNLKKSVNACQLHYHYLVVILVLATSTSTQYHRCSFYHVHIRITVIAHCDPLYGSDELDTVTSLPTMNRITHVNFTLLNTDAINTNVDLVDILRWSVFSY